ncbi:tetratricopeptide repeat protein [Sphingomonas sp. 28-63-12]|uniref:tetratricopeptide repeat protein n=1 Tax=Sphingomonas sp. 28-63-12 TaxID=1970434 RepID=UPI0035A945F7
MLLRWLSLPRNVWTITAAALLFGATGYVLQGSPKLPASPAQPQSTKLDVAPDIVELRGAFFGRFTGDAAYQTAADAMIRISDPASAVRVTLGGIDRNPRSVALWTELGSVLVTHDAGNVSPAALFAFRRAMFLAPRHPGPPFFLGLGYAQAGRLQNARIWWQRSLELSPPGASYRTAIQERLMLLDQFIAMSQAQGQQPAP